MRRVINWCLLNGLFAGCIYLGYVKGIENAESVAMFMAWAISILSIVLLTDAAKQELAKKGRAIPKTIDYIFDISVIFAFVWFGSIATGSAYLVHLLISSAAWDAAEKLRDNS